MVSPFGGAGILCLAVESGPLRVHAAVLRRERASAEVLVTLSGEEAPTQALLLTMVLESGAWKIRR